MKITWLEDLKRWEDTAVNCTYATFFHTPLWYSVFAETYNYLTIKPLRVLFDDGKSAVFPLMEERASVIQKNFISGPAGVYGGWITKDDLSPTQCRDMAEKVLGTCKNLYWRLNPLIPSQDLSHVNVDKKDSTELLFLEQFDSETALKRNYKNSVRNKINKANKQGFYIKEAETSQEWDVYYHLYSKSLERWGDSASNRYDPRLFHSFRQLNSPNVKLWLLLAKDKIIGGNLNFYFNRHCVEWHASFDPEYFAFGSRNFLVHHIINDARTKGYKYYDFNPSGGHRGTLSFKRSFNTTTTPSNLVCTKSNSLTHKVLWKTVALKNRIFQLIKPS